MSEVGHNDIDFPPNQLLNCSCNTLRLIADIALSRPMTAASMLHVHDVEAAGMKMLNAT